MATIFQANLERAIRYRERNRLSRGAVRLAGEERKSASLANETPEYVNPIDSSLIVPLVAVAVGAVALIAAFGPRRKGSK